MLYAYSDIKMKGIMILKFNFRAQTLTQIVVVFKNDGLETPLMHGNHI